MTYSGDTRWMKFDEALTALAERRWEVIDSEVDATLDSDGTKHRLIRKGIDCGAGVRLVAETSFKKGDDFEDRHETTVAAFLAVAAAEGLPRVAEELRQARDLLSQVQTHGPLAATIAKFLAAKSHADEFDARHNTTM